MDKNDRKNKSIGFAIPTIATIAFVALLISCVPHLFYDVYSSHSEMHAFYDAQTIASAIHLRATLSKKEHQLKTNKRYNAATPEEYDNLIEKIQILPGKKMFDPWGKRYDISVRGGKMFIYSYGANRIDDGGNGDDICSWKKLDPTQTIFIKFFGYNIFSFHLKGYNLPTTLK